MPHRYFRLSDDKDVPRRWYLDDPVDLQGNELNPWQFTKGRLVGPQESMRIPIYEEGRPLDFTATCLGSTPIVHAKVATLLSELAPEDIQVFPVSVERQPAPYFLINAVHLIQCIDDARCEEVRYYVPEDGQPAKTGTYKSVLGLRIDPSKVGDARIFRLWGWTGALIVREDIKAAMERLGVTGASFKEV
jgi:hypothetical protein